LPEEVNMSLGWFDVTKLSFNTLLLLERAQLSWFPGWLSEPDLALALQANPVVEWYLRNKCPDLNEWLNKVMLGMPRIPVEPERVRQAEVSVLSQIEDLLVYIVDPGIYDSQPFNNWDSIELTSLVDFAGKTAIDVGVGTGRLTMVAAEKAAVVFAVEPVANLRRYIKEKAQKNGFKNVYCTDGLITDLPFPDAFADVTTSGHVFGDCPEEEFHEMMRVTKLGGMIILMGTGRVYQDFLLSKGFQVALYEEPGVGTMGKFWLVR
jgi:2-polyprenyl-3-methyl-5-hydroxy-6-metoxy-1,4-benzoquinol methylase